jgi:ankyrin repeat protein
MNIHKAVKAGDLEAIRAWLQSGEPIDARDAEGHTPFLLAIRYAEGEAFHLLLEAGADPEACNDQGMNALSLAAAQGMLSMVRVLLERGADVNQGDASHMTPLMGAAASGHTALVRLLLEAGAEREARDKEGHTALKWARLLRQRQVINLLKQDPIDPPEPLGPAELAIAARTGDAAWIAECLAHGVPVDTPNENGLTPLMEAAEHNQRHAIEVLLAAGADPYRPSPNGFNPIIMASNQVRALRPFRAAGVDLDRLSAGDITPLMYAAQNGFHEVVQYLVAAGVDLHVRDAQGQTALDRAAANHQKNVAAFLKEKMGLAAAGPPLSQKAIQKKKTEGRALIKAANKGNLADIRALLDQGVPIDSRDGDDYTPLMRAAEHGQLEACRVLLEAGADAHAISSYTGIDALYIACADGNLAIARELLSRGVSLAARKSGPSDLGYTPLMAAVLSGNLELVRHLVEAGADVNAVARTGDTALKWAKEQRQQAIYAYLKQQGARPKTPVKASSRTLPAPVEPANPSDPMQVLRAEVKNFPHAAARDAFQEVLRYLAQAIGKEPTESSRRPGSYKLALTQKRVCTLADHFQHTRPTFRPARVEQEVHCIAELLGRLQQEMRGRGALLTVDALWNIDEPIKLRLYPTTNPYAVLAACGTNGANYGISTARVIAWLRQMHKTHPFVLTSCAHDSLAGDFLEPVFDARDLARKMYKFCPDIVDQGTETLQALARSLRRSQCFFFWWD